MGAAPLALKFSSAKNVRKAKSIVVPCQDCSPLQIDDDRLFPNTAAVLEGITVEKDIAGDGTPLCAGKQIPGEPVSRHEKGRTRDPGLYARRTKVEGEVLAEAQRKTRV